MVAGEKCFSDFSNVTSSAVVLDELKVLTPLLETGWYTKTSLLTTQTSK